METQVVIADEIRTEAEAIGLSWGYEEAQLWLEQSDNPMPEWTMGAYNGRLPGVTDESEQWDFAREVERIIDAAARKVWNAMRDEIEAS